MNCNRRIIYALSFLIFAEVDLLGCAFSGEQVLAERTERQKLENVYREVKEALTKQVAIVQESDGKLARLQLLLLEKELQKKELNRKIEEAMLEVVRTKAKLRSLETKAEAVSALAEGEIALKTVKTNVADDENDEKPDMAKELLKASGLELKKENYSGALYLTTQAKALIREDQERSKGREKKAMMEGEVPFAMPLPLQAISPTKVKDSPGHDSKTFFGVQQGTPFVGYSFKGPWVHVKAEDGRSGWIYYKQIDGR
jgi:uncharacterized protein YajQ (UPF0234 family)